MWTDHWARLRRNRFDQDSSKRSVWSTEESYSKHFGLIRELLKLYTVSITNLDKLSNLSWWFDFRPHLANDPTCCSFQKWSKVTAEKILLPTFSNVRSNPRYNESLARKFSGGLARGNYLAATVISTRTTEPLGWQSHCRVTTIHSRYFASGGLWRPVPFSTSSCRGSTVYRGISFIRS